MPCPYGRLSGYLLLWVVANGKDRELLDLGYVAFSIGFAIDGLHLLDDR